MTHPLGSEGASGIGGEPHTELHTAVRPGEMTARGSPAQARETARASNYLPSSLTALEGFDCFCHIQSMSRNDTVAVEANTEG